MNSNAYLRLNLGSFAGFFFNGALSSGHFASYLDLSPNFSGTIFGVSNTFSGGGTGFVVPLIIGALTQVMWQVPLERDINIAINCGSWWRLPTKNGPFMAMLITYFIGTCLINSKTTPAAPSSARIWYQYLALNISDG